ncbi:MAG: iron chelate uptake ABC transporter family permease subunit [Propionibacteriaceae bacterium]|nr:iron chelate uptake ABC transporter family permease subunit [Propionibacteriaceae bacterium]
MIDFGYAHRTLAGQRFALRSAGVNLGLAALAVLLVVFAMGLGEFPVTPAEVVTVATGGGDEFTRLVVVEWRLPIALAALVLGALLGLGGAIFQSLTRNPLGSPDIIGFDAGAYTAVLVAMLVFRIRDHWGIAAVSILGGLVAALLVHALAFRRGLLGFRLIIVGIAVSAMLGSLNSHLITRANVSDAMAVGFWAAGTLNRSSWAVITPVIILAVLLTGAVALLAPSLRQQELGDDAAVAHGVRLTRDRFLLIVLGVATTAVVTASAGPIGFIALAAPQMARRLARTPSVALSTSACMGAALLSLAHCCSVALGMIGRAIPVGLVTVCLGGCYFIFLLVQQTWRGL